MNTVTIRNIHTDEQHEVDLIEAKQTWQATYTVRLNGVVQTVTASQGWHIRK